MKNKHLGLHVGPCDECHNERLVNCVVMAGRITGYYCGDCWERLDFDQDRPAPTALPSRCVFEDPGFENTVRAFEEDR